MVEPSNKHVRTSLKRLSEKVKAGSASEGNSKRDLNPNNAFSEFEQVPQLGYSCFLNESFQDFNASSNSIGVLKNNNTSNNSTNILRKKVRDQERRISRLIYEGTQKKHGKCSDHLYFSGSSVSSDDNDENLNACKDEAVDEINLVEKNDLVDAILENGNLKVKLNSKVEECDAQKETIKLLESQIGSMTAEIARLNERLNAGQCSCGSKVTDRGEEKLANGSYSQTVDTSRLTMSPNNSRKAKGMRGLLSRIKFNSLRNIKKETQSRKTGSRNDWIQRHEVVIGLPPMATPNKRVSFMGDCEKSEDIAPSIITEVTATVTTNNDDSQVSFSSDDIVDPISRSSSSRFNL